VAVKAEYLRRYFRPKADLEAEHAANAAAELVTRQVAPTEPL
jgi:hypothetical protein